MYQGTNMILYNIMEDFFQFMKKRERLYMNRYENSLCLPFQSSSIYKRKINSSTSVKDASRGILMGTRFILFLFRFTFVILFSHCLYFTFFFLTIWHQITSIYSRLRVTMPFTTMYIANLFLFLLYKCFYWNKNEQKITYNSQEH